MNIIRHSIGSECFAATYDVPLFRTITITANALGIVEVAFGAQSHLFTKIQRTGLTDEAARQLELYFAGKLKKFDLPLCIDGTPFQCDVWETLCSIPYGEMQTYAQIAGQIGRPKAFRAVGSANGRNRIPIIIPCHRVVAVSGLGGYSGGLDVKRYLLKLEHIR